MKATTLFTVLAIMGAHTPALAEASETTSQRPLVDAPSFKPVIGFLEPRFNFGDREAGEMIEHEFVYLNNGGAELIVKNAHSLTSGVSVAVSAAPIRPGETGKVIVKLDTDSLDGEQFIRISLKSNAANGNSTLYLAGAVHHQPK